MIALVVGTLLAIGALAFVLWPLFDERAAMPGRRRSGGVAAGGAIDALREIEFDRATGKLSDTDYAALTATSTRAALDEMRAERAVAPEEAPAAAGSVPVDEAEAAVLRWRARRHDCPLHGPRPEPDAIYCSTCGLYLEGRCSECGAAVEGPGMTYCASCGHRLAA